MNIEVELYRKDGKYYGWLGSTEYAWAWETDGYDTKEECVDEMRDSMLREFRYGEEMGLIDKED